MPLLKAHALSLRQLIDNLSDAGTLRLTLDSLSALLPYLVSFKKVVREVVGAVVDTWAFTAHAEVTRMSAFIVVRRLFVIGDPSTKEAILRSTYQGLVRSSRNTTIHSLQGIDLMKNTASELWSLDATIGYTAGFVFIKQLAVLLRSSITHAAKDGHKKIYNWQFLHSLDFWSRVVSTHCSSLGEAESGQQSPLRPLIYPVVQITIGAMRLIPTAQYFPLRFQLIRSLLRISSATSTYIPLAAAIYEVLTTAEMTKPPKPSTLKPLDFSSAIKVPKSYLRTRIYQDGVGEEVVELLSEFLGLWSRNIAFPELALPVIVALKRWVKERARKSVGNRNNKLNSSVALLLQKLELNSQWIEAKRAKVDFAPGNRAGVEMFLKEVEWEKTPLGAYVAGQRLAKEKRLRSTEESRQSKTNGSVNRHTTEEPDRSGDELLSSDGQR